MPNATSFIHFNSNYFGILFKKLKIKKLKITKNKHVIKINIAWSRKCNNYGVLSQTFLQTSLKYYFIVTLEDW